MDGFDELAVANEEGIVEVFFDMFSVVGCDEEGFTLFFKRVEGFAHDVLGFDIDSVKGFIEEVEFGVVDEGASEEGALLLAYGEVVDLSIG